MHIAWLRSLPLRRSRQHRRRRFKQRTPAWSSSPPSAAAAHAAPRRTVSRLIRRGGLFCVALRGIWKVVRPAHSSGEHAVVACRARGRRHARSTLSLSLSLARSACRVSTVNDGNTIMQSIGVLKRGPGAISPRQQRAHERPSTLDAHCLPSFAQPAFAAHTAGVLADAFCSLVVCSRPRCRARASALTHSRRPIVV